MKNNELWKEIKTQNQNWMDAYLKGDTVKVAAFYTENALSMPPNEGFIVGQDAIQNFWKIAMESGIKGLNIQTKEVEAQNDTAYEFGETILVGENDSVIDRFKYMVIWKRQNDGWKIHREIWNSSLK